MNQRSYVRAAASLVWLSAFLPRCGMCAGDEAVVPPANVAHEPLNALVLRDGGVLSGTITRAGDRFVVTRAGSEIQVKQSDVLVLSRSLEEAYDQRRKQISRPTAESHLALAEWCLRHDLPRQAAREIVDARGFEPRHPWLPLLERRLAAASHTRSRDRSSLPVGQTAVSTASNTKADQPAMPAEELPKDVVERFTRKIQPILVNNCTTSGCHQRGGAHGFQLDRALLHGLANRRTTMQNLAATLTLVDRRQPHLSPLLTVPRRTHGGMRGPVFGPRQAPAYAHLVDWVARVTEPPASAPEAISTEEQITDRTILSNAEPQSVVQADFEVTANALQPRDNVHDDSQFRPRAKKRLQYGARLQPWQPKDAFDPAIFNRLPSPQVSTTLPQGNAR
jgi:hypothetical protein